jgi:two-component system CheB/CheR fusion protein
MDFVLLVCNQKFSGEFRKPDVELVGTTASGMFPTAYVEQMEQVFNTGAPYYHEHLLDGHPKWIATSMTRHDHGIAITELDITTLKEAGIQHQKLIVQLEGTSEMVESLATMKEYVQSRGAFLRTSFHDLRGSFGIIVGAATLLDMMDTEKDREKALDMIQRNLTQVSYMMNQLLDYSRLESGEEKFHYTAFDAAALLRELCEDSTLLAKQKGIHIRFEGPFSLAVEGDHVKVRRIAQNLILNALKYTIQGEVVITCRSIDADQQKAASWEFIVNDTGPGLPERLLAKLNNVPDDNLKIVASGQPYSSNVEHDIEGHGEGIGLFIVKRLCELLKAQMHVSSEIGKGTTFRIVLLTNYLVN